MSKARKIATCLDLAAGCIRDARLLAGAESRNAAYLASQAAEHRVTAVATAEDLHIERKDAHQLDTIVRRLPAANSLLDDLASITFLEAYATSYRYGTPTGRIPATPSRERLISAIDQLDAQLKRLRQHFQVPAGAETASRTDAIR